jgi:hypothetical protein
VHKIYKFSILIGYVVPCQFLLNHHICIFSWKKASFVGVTKKMATIVAKILNTPGHHKFSNVFFLAEFFAPQVKCNNFGDNILHLY